MRFLLLVTGWILWLGQTVNAQDAVLDSLKRSLPKLVTDSNDVNKILNISQVARLTDVEEATNYAFKAIEESRKINWKRGRFKGYYQAAVGLFSTYHIDSSLLYLDSAQAMALELKETRSIPIIYELQASNYSAKGAYFKALDTYKKAIDFQIENNQEVGLEYTYNNVAKLYFDLNDEKNGFSYALKAYKLAEAHRDTLVLGIILLNLSANAPDEIEKKKYALEAIEITRRSGDNYTLSSTYNNLASYYCNFQNEDSIRLAIYYIKKGMELSGSTQNPARHALFLKNLADNYLKLNNLDSARYYIHQGALIIPEEGSLDIRKDFYLVQSEIEAKSGNYQKAYEAQMMAASLLDSIYNEDLLKNSAFFNAQLKNDEQQRLLVKKELELSKRQALQNKIIGLGSLGLLMITLLFGGIYIRQSSQKEKVKRELAIETSKNEALQQLDELKSEFFSNISHELRTPLTLISGPLGSIKNQLSSPGLKREIDLAYDNSKKLLGLINDILDLSKLENKKLQLTNTNIHLLPWLKRTVFAFESYANNQKIDLRLDADIPTELHIHTDEKKLETIINNLLSNALKFSKPDTTVTLKATTANGKLLVKVRDEGLGIHPDDRDKIFQKFYQSSHKENSKFGGTGIGLALSRELSQLLGGSLTFESTWQQGSTFIFEMPIVSVPASTPIESAALPQQESSASTYQPVLINGGKPSILIVEDHPEMQQYLFGILEKDYRVISAGNGQEAINKIHQQHFDLIISDIMMPVMDGFELKKTVNKLENYRLIPFVFLTAKSLPSDKIAGFQLGVDDYITKPFERDELLARINILLKNKMERQSWQQHEAEQIPPPDESSAEQKLLKDLEAYILDNIDNPNLKVTDIAKELAYSQRQLSRLIKKWTGMTTVNLILEIRLQKARQLILQKKFRSITEVMMEVGIESPSYFSVKYKERFGVPPTATFVL